MSSHFDGLTLAARQVKSPHYKLSFTYYSCQMDVQKGLIIILFMLTSTAGHAQFPSSWVGEWEGTLVVERGNRVLMTTEIRLGIHALDSGKFSWTLVYGNAGEDERPYTLLPVDSSGSTWQIDEHNGIVLDAYLHGEVFYSRFEVMGNLLFTRDERLGDTLYHEIISGSLKHPTATGGGVLPKGDTIPMVNSFPLSTRQWAKLTRKPTLTH